VRSTRSEDPEAGFLDIPALIAMKRDAARPQDLIDIEKLRTLAEIRGDEPRA